MQVGQPLQIGKKDKKKADEEKKNADDVAAIVNNSRGYDSDKSDNGKSTKAGKKAQVKRARDSSDDNDSDSGKEEKKVVPKAKRARAPKKPKTQVLIHMELTSGTLLNKFVEQMCTFIESCELSFSEDGIEIGTIDTNHIAYCLLKISSSDMDAKSFVCPEQQVLGVNLTVLAKVLKACGSGLITFHQTDANPDILGVRCSNSKGASSNYSIKLLNIDQAKLVIPDINASFQATINADKFLKMVQRVKPFDDHIQMRCYPLKFEWSSRKNTDAVEVSQELVVEDDNRDDIAILYDKSAFKQHCGRAGTDTSYVRQEYGLKYALAFATVMSAASTHVTSQFTNGEQPGRFSCKSDNSSSFDVWLTPKTYDDDDEAGNGGPTELIVSDGDEDST